MKKNLLLLLAIVFTVSLFSSCSNDEETTAPSPISGKWNAAPVVFEEKGGEQQFVSGPVSMVWEAKEGTSLGFFPVESIVIMAEGLGGQILAQVLKDVTLDNNSNISATYSSAGFAFDTPVTPVWQNSGVGYATYKQVPNKDMILVFLNIDKIAQGEPAIKAIIEASPVLKKLITDGIPVNYKLDATKKINTIYIDKAFVTPFMQYIPAILEMIPDTDETAMLKGMIGGLPKAMEATTKFELGLNLVK